MSIFSIRKARSVWQLRSKLIIPATTLGTLRSDFVLAYFLSLMAQDLACFLRIRNTFYVTCFAIAFDLQKAQVLLSLK